MTALAATPEALRAHLRTLGHLDVGTIMPDEPSYYDRLLAPLGDSEHLLGFISNELAENRRLQLKRHSKQALRRIAYSALWQPLIPFELLASLRISDISAFLTPRILSASFSALSYAANSSRQMPVSSNSVSHCWRSFSTRRLAHVGVMSSALSHSSAVQPQTLSAASPTPPKTAPTPRCKTTASGAR